jgi:hypothetical protein
MRHNTLLLTMTCTLGSLACVLEVPDANHFGTGESGLLEETHGAETGDAEEEVERESHGTEHEEDAGREEDCEDEGCEENDEAEDEDDEDEDEDEDDEEM